jgi:6-phosphogluconolactonase
MEEQRVSGGGAGGADGGAPRRELRATGGGGGGAPRERGERLEREIRAVADAVELTRAAAAEVVAVLGASSGSAAAARAPFPSVALAGGSTPRALYRLLADPAAPFRARIDWQAVHFFWGDERHVPPDDPDSNYRMAREAMLDHVDVPAAHVHRIAAEEPDAARAARLYEHELIEVFGLRRESGDGAEAAGDADATRDGGAASDADVGATRDGGAASEAGATRDADAADDAAREWPRFDLMLLGLGEEGHTASLFPGSPLLAPPRSPRARRLAAAVWVEKLATWRITLTPPVLNRAATVIFLVSGAAKAPALAAVLEGERRPELYPAQAVAPIDGRLLWLVDQDAAAQLRSRS